MPNIDAIAPAMEMPVTVVRTKSEILVESGVAEPPAVDYAVLQDAEMTTDPVIAVKTVKPKSLSYTTGSSVSLNEMDLVEAKIRISNCAGSRLITLFCSMPNIDAIAPAMEMPVTVVRTKSEILVESSVAKPPVVDYAVLQDAEMTADPVIAVKTVKPKPLSYTMGSSASLNEMNLVEAKIRVRSYDAEGRPPKRFISTPNIELRTHTVEIRTPHDTTVQTELKTLTVPTVTVVHAGQPDTVVITENTVKPKRRSLWSRIKKTFRRVLCCGYA